MATLMGEASRQTYASTLPPGRFHCLLDELPLHLIPQPALAQLRLREKAQSHLFLNPDCIFCPAGQLPPALESVRELVSGFSLQGTIAWVRDPATGSLRPFWLGPELEAAIRALRTGKTMPSALPATTCTVLSHAGVLVSDNHAELRRREWKKAVEGSAPYFQGKGYAPLTILIHPFHVAALRRYYRYLIRTGAIQRGDRQSARRYVAYNEPVARFFHHQIATTLSALAGEPLKPSYVYMASYLSGAELKKHIDREQCEFSVTLCLDFSPEPALESPWPIRLESPTGTVTVHQALGDGLVYRGTRLPHYRGVLGEGQTSTSIFFHYVRAGFAGSLD
jgi:hypothetical protein